MSEFWLFAYGSLMWRPGFPFDLAVHARADGANRALCIYSWVYRGSPAQPGLVLGLDAGGSCHGMAFRLPASTVRETLAYVRGRELVTKVYREFTRTVHLLDGSERQVRAVCYMANRRHPQYAGALPLSVQAGLVRRGRGRSGKNIDYVLNTVAHLRNYGIADPKLERLLVVLGRHRLLPASL